MEKLHNKQVQYGVIALLAAGLYLTRLHSYPLFHSLTEIFSIVIAFSIFVVAWNSRYLSTNSYLLLLGIGLFFVGAIDMLHTLSYKGMGVFYGYGTDLPTQLWIAARSVQAASLLLAVLVIGRKLNHVLVFVAYAVAVGFLLMSIFHWRIFPVCFVEGLGLTPFKKTTEYVICVSMALALLLLFRKRKVFDAAVFRLLVISGAIAIASELAFTLYSDVFGVFNLIGHFLKIGSFYAIYSAIIVTGFREPYGLLFKELKEREESLAWESRVNASMAELSKVVISSTPIEEISDLVLALARRLTGSRFGFVGYLDPQTGYLISPTLTQEIYEACRMEDQQFSFHQFGGLWGWALNNRKSIITNSPNADTRSSGIPAGHVAIDQFLAAPAVSGDRLIGLVALANPGRDYIEQDLLVTERLAGMFALAVRSREFYEREHKIAETLQRSFLPEALPQLDGYELAQAYYPARDEAAVGGDVYDTFTLPNGKIGIVIADVSGKGLSAAKYGAMVKYTLRAYAYQSQDPGEVLARLNDLIAREIETTVFVTCFFGILDPAEAVILYANAGHDNPIQLYPDGACSLLEVTGMVLGAMEGSAYGTSSLKLHTGHTAVLYTDGVTDARGSASRMEIEGLQSLLVSHCPPNAQAVIDCIMDEVHRRSGDILVDDIAILALRRLDSPIASEHAQQE